MSSSRLVSTRTVVSAGASLSDFFAAGLAAAGFFVGVAVAAGVAAFGAVGSVAVGAESDDPVAALLVATAAGCLAVLLGSADLSALFGDD